MNADLIISDQPQLAMEFDLAVYGVALDDTAFYLKDNTFYMNILILKLLKHFFNRFRINFIIGSKRTVFIISHTEQLHEIFR